MSTTMRKDEAGKAKDQASQAVDKGREAAGHAGEAATHAAQSVGQKASDLAHNVGQKATDVAHSVTQKAGDLAHAAGQKAEDATSAVGGSLHSVADKVREYTPNEGMLGSASNAVAGAIDNAGSYVQDKNLSGMMDDVTGLIRRNPLPALLIGLGVGFLIGRALSSSRS